MGKHCGSIITDRSSKQGRLFSLHASGSQMATSYNLYMGIAKLLEEIVSDKLAKINRKMIAEVISTPKFNNVFFPKDKKYCLDFTFAILQFLRDLSSGNIFAKVCIILPLHGDSEQKKRAIEEIAERAGFREVNYSPRGIELDIILSDKNLPYLVVDYKACPSYKGEQRATFVTEEEYNSGQYSPIE